ncbi:MAG: hypothetical protein LBT33_01455 [Spirochaetia bacterium]|nr:hypothetical protein [Spirochaetia bacterium]
MLFSLASALLAGCLSHLGTYGEAAGDQQVFLEIESGLEVVLFDGAKVGWGTDSFGGYAGIIVPPGAHTLLVLARKDVSDEGSSGIITKSYTLSAELRVDFLPRHSYRLEEDGSILDFFFGAYDLKLKVEDTGG